MKGDFSWFDHQPLDNYTGVLEQQGRVRLDRDGLAAAEITRHLRSLLGRDAFGPGRVAVPAEAPNSLRVTAADTDGAVVNVTMQGGRAWVDGIPLHIGGAVTAEAEYLSPPLQDTTAPASIAAGVRDAVVLEVWEDSVSAFQEPDRLLEPALGGADTTERVKVFYRFALRRLADDEDCATIGPSLIDQPENQGRLTATPSPAIAITGDCPVEAGGGYTGDGHVLMTVEIARPGPAGPRFVWSRFGGGLVGRGRFDAVTDEIEITHNMPMLDAAGISGAHLQALSPEPGTGEWRVRFEVTVSSAGTGVLNVTDASGTWPAAPGETAFFRVWDGIGNITDFDDGPTELADGIRLEFDPPFPGGYREGDRWQFQARAAGVGFDPSVWPNQAPPQAIRYHRAPLAILEWQGSPPTEVAAPDTIEDCRDGFPPLTDPCHCCTITVGDGRTSHGDTDSIEEAIDRLPASGGRICLLPGRHETNAVIEDRAGITIAGCGKRTMVIPRPGRRDQPIFSIVDSECITLEEMDIIALDGVAIFAQSSDDVALRQFTVQDCRILGCARAIQVEGGAETVIHHNRIRMLDKPGAGVAVYLTGEDCRIEDNDIGVVPADATPVPPRDGPDDITNPDDPTDPCADAELIYADIGFLVGLIEFGFAYIITSTVPPPYQALGGLQIGAEAERISIVDNRIQGGAGNGITLGGSHLVPETGDEGGNGQGVTGGSTATENLSGPTLSIRGTVSGAQTAGVSIRITSPNGVTRTAVTDASGGFQAEGTFEGGAHVFEAIDPGLGVTDATQTFSQAFGAGTVVVVEIVVAQATEDPRPEPSLGFLYAIRIDDNEITAMGLSGIGTPPAVDVLTGAGGDDGIDPTTGAPTDITNAVGTSASSSAPPSRALERATFSPARAGAVNALLARIGHPVVDLTISNNRIIGNLRNPFTTELYAYARTFGIGGISLGIAETVTIIGNRIEGNGRRHIDPVCGIFGLLIEQMVITDNLIRNNGPIVQTDAEPERGIRGGVAGFFLAVGLDDLLTNRRPAAARPALQLHDNVILQPLGRALTMIGAGPVSICSNTMTSELTGTEAADLMAGAVLAFSLSGVRGLPSGGMLVNSNQISMGGGSNAIIAVTLAGTQDVGLDANQIDAQNTGIQIGGAAAMVNTLVFAATARATGNRFTEIGLPGDLSFQLSLVQITLAMNIATMNQANHCIFAADGSTPPRLVNAPNQIFDNSTCDGLGGVTSQFQAVPIFGLAGADAAAIRTSTLQLDGDSLLFAQAVAPSLEQLNGFQVNAVRDAAEIKSVSRALNVNELARLGGRTSTRNDLLADAAARVDTAAVGAARLEAVRELVASRPEIARDPQTAVFTGRAVDRAGRGIAGARVFLSDGRGQAIEVVDPVATDALGNFSVRVPPALLEELREVSGDNVTVTVQPQGDDAPTGTSARVPLEGGGLALPEIRIDTGSTGPVVIGRDPIRVPGGVIDQPLVRPGLSSATRPALAGGRVSDLLRESRPARTTTTPIRPGRG